MRRLSRIFKAILDIEGGISIWQWLGAGAIMSSISAIVAYIKEAPVWQIVVIWIAVFLLLILVTRRLSAHFWPSRGLDRVNSTLRKMEQRLLKLASMEEDKPFDVKKWEKVNVDVNTKMLGLATGVATTVEEAEEVAADYEATISGRFDAEDGERSAREGLKTLVEISALLDSRGFGLKVQREQDKMYAKWSSQVDEMRNLAGAELNKLIGEHIVYAEMIGNMRLTKYRNMRFGARVDGVDYTFVDFLSPLTQSLVEGMEQNMREFLHGIRAEINDCIRETKKGKRDG